MSEPKALGRIGAIILDLDDTLFEARNWNVSALRHAGRLRGMDGDKVDQSIDSFLSRHDLEHPELYNAILLGCSQSDSGVNIRALHETVSSYRGEGHNWQLFPGTVEALLELAPRYRLVLLTEGHPEAQLAKISALHLEPLVHDIIHSDSIDGARSRRPDLRGLQAVVDKLAMDPQRMLFVGDHPARDFACARELGLYTCRVFTGDQRASHYPSREARADFEITTIARLPGLLTSPQGELSHYLVSTLPFLRK